MTTTDVMHVALIEFVQRAMRDGKPITVECGAIVTVDPETYDERARTLPLCADCERIVAALVSTGQSEPLRPDMRTAKEILDWNPAPIWGYTVTWNAPTTWSNTPPMAA